MIAMPNWPSGQATSNILKVSIAERFGLDAEVRAMGTLSAFRGLDSGEVDIHPEVWRPNLDELIRKYESDKGSVIVSLIGVPAWQGLCATPEAASELGIKDVADLSDPEKATALDTDGDGQGELWIGAPTWSSTAIERVRANSYGYAKTLTLVEVEEDVGMAAVDAAVATGRPMVFACYAPHHVFKLHDIVRLEEPAHDHSKWKIASAEDPLWISKSSATVAWPISHFHIAYSTKFGEEHPDVAAFLEKVNFRPAEVNAMTYALQVERQDPYDYAKNWVADNSGRVDEWVKP
ncbi:amino acid-binding protein [Chelativorans sp. EGI FJ00035]|uniref:Amino acid-binding protein n=2 Tax=Chelativorans salis TaxID=2978478 RepID=A0ABT2LV83_9HYPH|nr:glycine betaine ABC transporter substrate-binding protein [Chelativorans sp. EGI FJ00035]MCT7378441.1 amino acid-binding protein [Chelativorans sp. EGI FJ00035]